MESARINFGIPNSEYVVAVDDTGAAISCKNVDTDTEYVGGGGPPFVVVTIKAYDTTNNVNVDIASLGSISTFLTSNNQIAITYANGISPILNVPIIDSLIFQAGDVEVYDENETMYLLDSDTPIKSVNGNIEKDSDNLATITGDGEIILNVIPD